MSPIEPTIHMNLHSSTKTQAKIDAHSSHSVHNESFQIFLSLIAICFSSYTLIYVGIFLEKTLYSKPFLQYHVLATLVPVLLGLKGNVEMSLAARLGTLVQCNQLTRNSLIDLLIAAFIQTISITICASTTMCLLFSYTPQQYLFIFCTTTFATLVASIVLNSLCAVLAFVSPLFNIDMDNISGPLAASLGDYCVLSMVSFASNRFYTYKIEIQYYWVGFYILFIVFLGIYFYFRNSTTILYKSLSSFSTWIPIALSMVFQLFAGHLLHTHINTQWIGLLPLANSLGGNLTSIFSSKYSSFLCKKAILSKKSDISKHNSNNFPTLYYCLVLLLILLPNYLIVYYFLPDRDIHPEKWPYFSDALLLSIIQVSALLFLGFHLVTYTFKKGWNPDSIAMPILAGIGDLLSGILVAFVFKVN